MSPRRSQRAGAGVLRSDKHLEDREVPTSSRAVDPTAGVRPPAEAVVVRVRGVTARHLYRAARARTARRPRRGTLPRHPKGCTAAER